MLRNLGFVHDFVCSKQQVNPCIELPAPRNYDYNDNAPL